MKVRALANVDAVAAFVAAVLAYLSDAHPELAAEYAKFFAAAFALSAAVRAVAGKRRPRPTTPLRDPRPAPAIASGDDTEDADEPEDEPPAGERVERRG